MSLLDSYDSEICVYSFVMYIYPFLLDWLLHILFNDIVSAVEINN